MNSPIDQIEEGILDCNWELVCEGFEKLTGSRLPVPDQTDSSEAMQKIHDISAKVLGLDLIAEICGEKDKTRKRKKKTGNKKGKTIHKEGEDSSILLEGNKRTPGPRSVGTVQHITNIPDPTEVEKNKAKAKITDRANTQKRQAAKKYRVKCNECQNKFDSDRPKGEMGQKCNKCLSGRKSQFV